jgi:hypothetical protein
MLAANSTAATVIDRNRTLSFTEVELNSLESKDSLHLRTSQLERAGFLFSSEFTAVTKTDKEL